MPTTSLRRILVISLGNPGEYRDTYHSAGHVALEALQRHMGRGQPPFSTTLLARRPTAASVGPRYSLLQSPTLMNVSGPWVARAYREHLAQVGGLAPAEVGLVLVHDDLEEELGVVKTRDWKRSHRGHNGVRSVNAALERPAGSRWARVSIGIGRPEARTKWAVSDFVLSKMPAQARSVVEEAGGRRLSQALMELETKWTDGK
ncbi:hypothetical protein VTK26DRAFT_8461 [Humicola hyalothermophila]